MTSFSDSSAIEVSGEGRFVGIVLRGTDSQTENVTVLGGAMPSRPRVPTFLMPVGRYPAVTGSYEWAKTYPNQVTLPAGKYETYLIADGSPSKVTLRLPELSGSTVVRPTSEADSEIRQPSPKPVGGAGVTSNSLAAGVAGHLQTEGLVFHLLSFQTDVYATGHYAFCYSRGDGPEPAELGPVCPAGSEKWSITNDRSPTTTPDPKLFMESYGYLPPGRHMVGLWMASESLASDVSYLQVWLEF
jgi:hypothetical protein